MDKYELGKQLEELNDAVNSAIQARKEWMDEHMKDYARYKIGEELYHRDTGVFAGVVTEYYRYHAGDARFDDSMSIEYRFKLPNTMIVDNTSRQHYSICSKAEMENHFRSMLNRVTA